MRNLSLACVLFFDTLALFYGANTLSLSYHEAKGFFSPLSLSSSLAHLGVYLFGANDIAARFFFIILHLASCILMYSISLKYFLKEKDAFYCLIFFILLPGSVASALIINSAGIVVFITLLILWCYFYKKTILFYLVLIASFFCDKSFAILYLSLFFYGLYKKDSKLFLLAFVLFAMSINYYGFEIGGKPKSYFLDSLGIFAACFSPLVFLYFFYTVYKLTFVQNKELLWFIMATTFIFCLLLSFRQKLFLDDFLPFCVVCIPLVYKNLVQSWRLRLPCYRFKYNVLISSSLALLVISYFSIVFNNSFYFLLSNPKEHFAYNYHLAAPLAKRLKIAGIKAVNTDPQLALRLRFYGVKSAKWPILLASDKSRGNLKIKFGKNYEYFTIINKNLNKY